MAMTQEQREAYFEQYGCYPLENEDMADSAIVLTAEQIEQAEAIIVKRRAKQYLADTDWYATRYAETGTAIPEDIAAARAQARIDASED